MTIELVDLEHTYPTGDCAVAGVSLTFQGTQPVAIIGQNGAGKTTLVKHFNGILHPSRGRVAVDGVAIEERQTAQWAKTVGYVFQNPDDQLFSESVQAEFVFGPRQIGMGKREIGERLDYVAELVGLRDKLDTHPYDLTSTQKKFCTIGAVLMLLTAATAWSLATRIPLKVNVLKDHGTLSREADDGSINNIYELKIMNTSDQTRTFRLSIAGIDGLRLENNRPTTVKGGEMGSQTIVLSADPGAAKAGANAIEFRVEDVGDATVAVTEQSKFWMP